MRKLFAARQTNFLFMLLLLSAILMPSASSGSSIKFEQWLENLRKEALQKKISKATIDAALGHVKQNKRVLELDQKQPEFSITTQQYLKKLVSLKKVKRGGAKLRKHRKLLSAVEKKYSVQPRFVVALWGVETDFGRLTGGFSVVDALVTLAFDGRRSDFFREELFKALRILDHGHVTVKEMTGSWAGAMGQCQFMPSSFLSYAQDFNKDGKEDIWGTLADVFASAANYLAKSGWDSDQTWGREVIVPRGFDTKMAGLKKKKWLSEWQKLGIRRLNRTALPKRRLQASLIQPDGPTGKSYLVYDNFRVLLKWNRSFSFAIAVGRLSDKILVN